MERSELFEVQVCGLDGNIGKKHRYTTKNNNNNNSNNNTITQMRLIIGNKLRKRSEHRLV